MLDHYSLKPRAAVVYLLIDNGEYQAGVSPERVTLLDDDLVGVVGFVERLQADEG